MYDAMMVAYDSIQKITKSELLDTIQVSYLVFFHSWDHIHGSICNIVIIVSLFHSVSIAYFEANFNSFMLGLRRTTRKSTGLQ